MLCCASQATSTNERIKSIVYIRNKYFYIADRQININFWMDELSIPIKSIDSFFCSYTILKGISILEARVLN